MYIHIILMYFYIFIDFFYFVPLNLLIFVLKIIIANDFPKLLLESISREINLLWSIIFKWPKNRLSILSNQCEILARRLKYQRFFSVARQA